MTQCGKEVNCLSTNRSAQRLWHQARVVLIALPAFVSAICFYFQFYVSVLQLSAIVVYLSSQQAQQSASEPKEYSATVQNSASVPNLDDANGHKAIKIKKLRNHFKLNSIRAKLKQRTTVAIYRPATHTRVKAAKNTRYKNPQFVAQHEKICCVTSCKFDDKRGTKPKQTCALLFATTSLNLHQRINEHFCCPTS